MTSGSARERQRWIQRGRAVERGRREEERLWHFGAICFVCIWDTLNVIDTCYVNALGCPKSQSPLHPLPLFPFFAGVVCLSCDLKILFVCSSFCLLICICFIFIVRCQLIYSVAAFLHVSLLLFSFFFRRALLPGKYALIKCVSLYPLSLSLPLSLS